jgi:hypothetical protein
LENFQGFSKGAQRALEHLWQKHREFVKGAQIERLWKKCGENAHSPKGAQTLRVERL